MDSLVVPNLTHTVLVEVYNSFIRLDLILLPYTCPEILPRTSPFPRITYFLSFLSRVGFWFLLCIHTRFVVLLVRIHLL